MKLDKDTFTITQNKHTVNVTVYSLNHTVTCNGYGFSLKKSKLKAEYQGVDGAQIGKLRKVEHHGITFAVLIFLGRGASDGRLL
jgi:hypothetical protein